MSVNKTTGMNDVKLPKPGMALALLFCIFGFCLILCSVLVPLLMKIFSRPEAAMRIATVLQDLFVFILPAVATAMVVTKLPARLLAIDRKPSLPGVCLSILTLIVAVPSMNLIVEWNQHLHLPDSMYEFENAMRELENNAEATVNMLMAGASVPSLIVSVLIVGVLAGLSEELFFRGGMQRIVMCMKLNPHLVIWTVAVIFSLFHFQFFGFVPRVLLGAFFGYLVWWSGCLWLPIIVHALNNSIVVVSTWLNVNDFSIVNIDKIGSDTGSTGDIILVVVSLILTTVSLIYLRKTLLSRPE